jgi:hypothetical protein
MMALAKDARAPTWRNAMAWGAMGAVTYFIMVWGSGLALHQDILIGMTRSGPGAALIGLGLIVASAASGFTSRKRPVTLKNLRNFAIRDAVVIALFLLVVWGITSASRAGALDAMSASAQTAAATGAVLVVVALLGSFVLASAHTKVDVIDDEMVSDEMRERGRLMLCSFAWMVACGLLLIVLGLAGPGGPLPPAAALAGALLLIAILVALGIAASRLSDELGRTLSRETGHAAFYLILAVGGGWAMLAHLGFTAAPAPIGWITLFAILLFAGAFIATGRRRLLIR